MKVTLVNVRTMTRNVAPLGILYIAAVLEADGVEVKVIDPRPRIEEGYDYVGEILRTEPHIVGFTLLSNQVKKALPIIHELKRRRPNVKVIVGGPHATFMYEQLLAEPIDVAVIGEGELTSRELVRALMGGKPLKAVKGIAYKGKSGKIVRTEDRGFIENLDDLPLPARHLVDMSFYAKRSVNIRGLYKKTLSIMTSRGCPGECIFCASPIMWRRQVRYRSPKNVLDEMEMLYNKYNLEGFTILDDTFALNGRHVHEICEGMRKRGIDVIWNCQGRVNTATRAMLGDMVKAGCVQIEYGVESGSQRILDIAKKQVTVKQIEDAFRMSKEFPIRRFANFIVGFPSETREDIELTRKLAARIGADHYEFFVLTPYPGTEILDIAIKNGYRPQYQNILWEHGHRGKAQAYWESEFSREQIIRIRDELQSQFRSKFVLRYATNPYVIADFLGEMLEPGFYADAMKIRSGEDFVYFVVDRISR